jgi:hypothetical protein
MAIDYAAIEAAGGIGKGTPGVVLKDRRQQAKDDREQAWKDAIDKRDGFMSRVSGKPLAANTTSPKLLRDHCHIQSKKTHPEIRYEVWNGFNASRYEHKLIHAGWIEIEGTDANKRLIFRWAAHVPAKDRTFRMLSKRRSQNRD